MPWEPRGIYGPGARGQRPKASHHSDVRGAEVPAEDSDLFLPTSGPFSRKVPGNGPALRPLVLSPLLSPRSFPTPAPTVKQAALQRKPPVTHIEHKGSLQNATRMFVRNAEPQSLNTANGLTFVPHKHPEIQLLSVLIKWEEKHETVQACSAKPRPSSQRGGHSPGRCSSQPCETGLELSGGH